MARIDFLADHAQHLPTLASWHYEEWATLLPGWSHAAAKRELPDHASRRCIPTTLVLLDDNGDLLGSVAVVLEDAREFRDFSPWLAGQFVAPNARRRGFGSWLVRVAENFARAQGVARLVRFAPDRTAFYPRLGWSLLASRKLGARAANLMVINLSPTVRA